MLQKMWKEFLWIAQYARRYWKAMIFYTALGVFGTGVSLASSVISKDLVDIITGHQTGKLLQTFALMIGFSFGNTLISQASAYASTMINLKVDREIQNDIFAKILVTDWESLTAYHTGDLVTRWSSDASNISSGILNWLPKVKNSLRSWMQRQRSRQRFFVLRQKKRNESARQKARRRRSSKYSRQMPMVSVPSKRQVLTMRFLP